MMIQTETEAMKEGIERKQTTIGTTPNKNGKSETCSITVGFVFVVAVLHGLCY
jgi:hypothetical protein